MKRRIIFTLVTILWVASACVPADDIDPPVVTSTQAVTSPVRVEPSPSVTNTQTQTTIPTMTFVPALPVEEAEIEFIALLQNNGYCRLPCLWGITPGETSLSDALSRLHAFSYLALNNVSFDFNEIFDEFGGGLRLIIRRDELDLQTYLRIEGTGGIASETKYMRASFLAYEYPNDGIQFLPVYGDPRYHQLFYYYTLPSILATYGPPENAYVFFEAEMGASEFYLGLDYTSSGWTLHLEMPLTVHDGMAIGCPNEALARFWLWHPDDLESAHEYGYLGYQGPIKPIEETTSMTMDEFYRTFSDPANTACLETPISVYEP
ncbi:MAG: hypothetical protein ABIJ39_10115 [Chloroflexota bacterium]